ncbi:uncharacterized protein LOC124456009 isoform X1 [Xenia sp. Carnegie-2017]|uniref:uncharacterized protein LOC124456009 isoform X1 n=1 Tax=Xenia sp. Carnegie-2017 TaxID=2897299 RepID=UPI001F04A70C|nr:uncharacterized protein LOC124456009 isoform X1 [Xenia sp. Carnegie-2017]XP_046862509.1 uncharacterized protein LOC124456009 isoform X1 [Xenia sp. Carnegie-2017]XP_046862510.1 uncharacterized protein LOC124456009 isoform X1 [Xenia sp. Carnegie-2017]
MGDSMQGVFFGQGKHRLWSYNSNEGGSSLSLYVEKNVSIGKVKANGESEAEALITFAKAQDKHEADFYNLLFAKNEETYCLDEKNGKIFAVKKSSSSFYLSPKELRTPNDGFFVLQKYKDPKEGGPDLYLYSNGKGKLSLQPWNVKGTSPADDLVLGADPGFMFRAVKVLGQ